MTLKTRTRRAAARTSTRIPTPTTHDRATHDRATHDRATHDRATLDGATLDGATLDGAALGGTGVESVGGTQVRAATDRVITAAAFSFYVVVFASVAAMSYRGLTAFAVDTLGLSGWWRYVVPVSLDGAAISASFFAYRASIHGEPAFGPRLLVCLFGGASAFFNWHEAASERGLLAASFYAGMSVLVVLMFDLGAKQIRRRALARQGKLEAPLPRFRLARWLLAPVETFHALRIAALESDLTAEQAVRLARIRRTTTRSQSAEPADTAQEDDARPVPSGSADQPSAPAHSALAGPPHARPPQAAELLAVDGDLQAEAQHHRERDDDDRQDDRRDGVDGDSASDQAQGAGNGAEVHGAGVGGDGVGASGGGGGRGRGAAEDRAAAVLAMLRSAVGAGRPLTGREVADQVGCHVGEGRKLLREARLQDLQERLTDAARAGGEVTTRGLSTGDIMALYQVRADHADKLLFDALRSRPPQPDTADQAETTRLNDGRDGSEARRRLVPTGGE